MSYVGGALVASIVVAAYLAYWLRKPVWRRCSSTLKLILVAAPVVGIMVVLIVESLPAPQVRSSLRAAAETIRLTVVNPDVAATRIGATRAFAGGEAAGACVEGLLIPATGSEVLYQRIGRGPLAITIGPGSGEVRADEATVGWIETAEGDRRPLRGFTRLVPDDTCPGTATSRVAIHGDVSFGREFQPASASRDAGAGQLSNAEIHVFGRAVERILWIVPLRPTVYPITSLRLPDGARVRAERREGEAAPVWWGLGRVEPDAGGIQVEASTSARNVLVVVPEDAGAVERSTIRIGDTRQLTEDPNVFWFFAGFSLIVAALSPLLSLIGWLRSEIAPAARRPVRQSRPVGPRAARGLSVAVLALASLAAGRDVAAEPVRLPTGPDSGGQGWMFTDHAGVCRIVTAAHVIERGGRLIAPVAIDRGGREIATARPVRPDPAVDIAFLEARSARACPQGGLQEATADQRLAAAPQAFLEVLGQAMAGTVQLVRRGRAMDEDGGRIVLFERASAAVSITAGMSGGMVVDGAGRPLAVLTSTDAEANRARAVRVDVAAAMLRTRVAREGAPQLPITGWTVVFGRSADPSRGPDQIVTAEGWTVVPDRGFVTVDVRFRQATRVGTVAFQVDEASRGRITSLVVSGALNAQQPPAEWPTIASCTPPPGAADITCTFAAGPVFAVRLQLRAGAQPVSLAGLSLRP